MIDHTGIGVADVARSASFYDAALGALGLRGVMQIPENSGADAVGYGIEFPVFWIDRFHPHSVKQHVGGTGKLPMSEPRDMCAGLDFSNVRIYIARGNVVFDVPGTKASSRLRSKLSAAGGCGRYHMFERDSPLPAPLH